MPWISCEHQKLVADILDDATMSTKICPCKERITAIVKTSEIVTEKFDGFYVFADILEPVGYPRDNILRSSIVPPQCGHDGITGLHMVVNKEDISRAVSKEKLLVFNARVSFANQSPILDVRNLGSGMIDLTTFYPTSDIKCAELFCGGFSGWTHAIEAMRCSLLPLRHVWALDMDFLAVQTYVKSHKGSAHINCNRQAWEHRNFQSMMEEQSRPVFQADIRDAWYLNHVPNDDLDVMVLSPPCQPWSKAHTSQGFNRADGKTLVFAITKASCLRPKVLILEEVAQFGKHDQFPLVSTLFEWAGFEVVDYQTLNLNKLLPQNRARFLLVAIDKFASGVAKFIDWAHWPIPANVTIRRSRVILPIDVIDMKEVVPSHDVMDMYMDHRLLPPNEYSAASFAGTKMQVRKIRIKVIDDRAFGCIMANYRKAHDLPKQVIEAGGLYGTFLFHDNVIRFLSTGEIFLLMGPTKGCRLPLCHDAQSHLIGNCISVPHAAIAIINGLRCISSVNLPGEPEHLFAHVFGRRLTSDNLVITCDDNGLNLVDSGEINFLDEPTMDLPSIAPLIVSTPTSKYDILIENGVNIKQALEIVAGPSTPKQFVIQSADGIRVPMLDSDVMGRMPLTIHTNLPSIMCFREKGFALSETNCCLILTPMGPVMIHRQYEMKVRQVLLFLREFFPEAITETAVLTDQFGIPHRYEGICPDIVMVQNDMVSRKSGHWNEDFDLPYFTEFLDHLSVRCDWSRAFKIMKFYHDRGLTEMLKCLGWSIQIIPAAGGNTHHVNVNIAKLPSQLAMKCVQIQSCLNARLLIQALPPSLEEDIRHVRVHFKLWDTYVFQGFCRHDDTIAILIDAWETFSALHGSPSCLRTVFKGKKIMKHVTFGELLSDASSAIRIHAVLQLQGGGNKQDAIVEVKHSLAIFLMGQGAELKDISTMLEVLGRNAGLQALKNISDINKTKDKLSALHQLALSMNVKWPENLKNDDEKKERVKNWSKKRALSTNHFCANHFTLLPEVFVNEDGSHPNIRSSVITGASGVVLLDYECAKPWLIDQKVITADEMAIAVLGHQCPCEHSDKCQRVNLPVHTCDGSHVIIKACFHNLGEKKIAIKPCANDQIAVNAGTVAAVTIYRDEIPPGDWKHVTSGPVRYALTSFDLADEAVFQGPPWGRSWLANGIKASPENASSLQFHVRVDSTKLESMMRSSGSNGTYITPKADNNLADNRYTIVWVEGNPIDIAQSMLKTPEHLGQVRVNKGKGDNVKITRGVRCKREQFMSVFAKILPNEEAPDVTPIECLYKIQPAPVGAQMKDVQAWMKLHGWEGRPLKLLGDKCWLIGSAKSFDKPYLSWNSSSILIKKVQSKHVDNASPIVAGKITRPSEKPSESLHRGGVDPLSIADP